jgi:UDP:flavonoid glycosyltransferase YjiC (YdhE family)
MRILLTSNRGAGHVGPLLPFAHAFLRAGDEVLLAAPLGARELAASAGVPFSALADPPQDEIDAVTAAFPGLTHEEQGVRMMRDVFAGIDARSSLPRMLQAVATFRPDVILSEPTEYAGLLAAERFGVPFGRIGIMSTETGTWSLPIVAPVLDGHREALGLRADPLGRRVSTSPYMTVFPEALEAPGRPMPALRFREPPVTPEPAEPLYVSYGSVLPTMPYFPQVFRATIDALDELGLPALFTVGTEVDVAALGPVPAHVRVERWVPQAAVMPSASAVVGHGGSGTTRMALAAGVPQVIFPAFADQPRNAARVAELGAGIALGEGVEALAGLADAVRTVLGDPSYRAAARRVAAEIAGYPLVDEAPAIVRGWVEDATLAA